jgi:hypothetical protein
LSLTETYRDRQALSLRANQAIEVVTVLPGRRYPDLINDHDTLLENSFVVPDAALADVPAALRADGAGLSRAGSREDWTWERLFITRKSEGHHGS